MAETIILRGDSCQPVSALLEIADAPLESLNGLPGISEIGEQFACIEVHSAPALPAGEITVRFKPSNRLNDLVAALRAFKRDSLLGEKGHLERFYHSGR